MKRIIQCVALATVGVFLFTVMGFSYSAPTKNAHFFGDANGDLAISAADITQHNNYIFGKSYTYDTLQPATSGERWNTCDLNHDRACSTADVTQMNNFLYGKTVSLGADDPWGIVSTLTSPQQPLQVINFRAGLYATPALGQSGVPGISIEVTIDNLNSTTTGYLVGRDCAGGTGDVPAPAGAQCAIGVAITQWGIDPLYGWTELSPLPLGVYADGNGVIELDFEMAAKASLDLPQVTFSQQITFSGVVPDQIAINCPTNVNETGSISCPVTTASGPSACAIGPNDTCGGSIDAGCVGPYTAPAQGEAAGPGSCVAHVVKGTASDQHTITIDEVNQAPYFTSTAPTSATEGVAFSYNPTYADNDLPNTNPGDPGYVTCAVSNNTCGAWLSFTGCNASGTPGEADAPGSCGYTLTVTDGYSASAQQNVSLTLNEVNQAPYFTSTAPTSATEGVAFSYNPTYADNDLPNTNPGDPGYVTCAVSNNTCGAWLSFTGCNASGTPGEADAPGSCGYTLTVTDGYSASAQQNVSLTLNEVNQAPYFTSTAPTSATEGVAFSYNPTYADNDLPNTNPGDPGYVTCAVSGNTCGAWLSFTGCNASGTPGEADAPGSCGYTLTVTDGYSASAQQNVSLTLNEVNQAPYFTSTAPTSATEGVAFSYNPTYADNDLPNSNPGDPGYVTCAVSGNTCGAWLSFTGCNASGTPGEADAPGSCGYTLTVTDGYSASAQQNVSLTLNEVNQAPYFTSTAPTSATEGVAFSYNPTYADNDLPNSNPGDPGYVTCAVSNNTCGAWLSFTGCNASGTPTEASAPGSCGYRLTITDGYGASAQQNVSLTLNEVNVAPTWTTQPTNITVNVGQSYNQVNGVAADTDLPNSAPGNPGYLSCSTANNTCSFSVNASGTGAGSVNCTVSFTAGGSAETCTVDIRATDGWSTPLSVSKNITITVQAATVNWTGTSVTGTVGGIRPAITRIQSNYPADFGQVTLNFSGAISACSATVNCTRTGGVAVTGTPSGNNCVLSANSGSWPSNDTCTISGVTTTPSCTGPNCGGSDQFQTSLKLNECASRGGTCGGFIDNGTYGSGNSITIQAVNFETGTLIAGSGGNHVYVQVEQNPPSKIERFDGNDDGEVVITSTAGLLSQVAKVTAAYKGASGLCNTGETDCFRVTTMADVDSRKVRVPLKRPKAVDWQLPEAQIWGYIPVNEFSKVGRRPSGNVFPNPLRGGFAMLGLLDQSYASIDLAEILRETGDLSTMSLCFNNLGVNVGGLELPGNLLLPDVVRQNWNAACSGHYKMSPPYTVFRIFTNRGNMTRSLIVIGASVITSNFNLYKSLDITVLPITMTAMGTDSVPIPNLTADINIGDVGGGTWGQGTTNPKAVPFEWDYRASGSWAGAIGAQFSMTEHNYPYDPARVEIGTSKTPNYGDPNRWATEASLHSGQMFILGEMLQINGARTSTGLVVEQIKMVPNIDDAQFTVFQKMNTQTKAFANVEPWDTSSTDTEVTHVSQTGLPSTISDTNVDWANAEHGCVWILLRGFVEAYQSSGAASMPETVEGSTATAKVVGPFQNIVGSTQGNNNWLPIPTVSSPTPPQFVIPPQADSRGWPINRNGQIRRGTAVSPTNTIQLDGNGLRYFTINNPTSNVVGKRTEVYELSLLDFQHIANTYNDPVREYPDTNELWKIIGNVNGQASLTVTLPAITPGAATLDGVSGIIPDPFEGGNFAGQRLLWNLVEHIFDTSAAGIQGEIGGIDGVFRYRNLNYLWTYDATYQTTTDSREFIWQ